MKRKVSDAQRPPKLIGAYEKLEEIGRGTYGTVYAGKRHIIDSDSNNDVTQRVAIKKVLGRVDSGKREAAFLQRCRGTHHVVQLLDVVERNDKLYLILEYMASDLERVISDTVANPILPIAHVKTYLRMLLTGVYELHSRNILHRDLKPNNVLLSFITSTGVTAKITDFGMATLLDDEEDVTNDTTRNNDVTNDKDVTNDTCVTNDTALLNTIDPLADVRSDSAASTRTTRKRSLQVVTRAYRAPELFFGQDEYGQAVDMWSIGCIFGELLRRTPLFDGASDLDQLSKIFLSLGSPSENHWTAASDLPFYLRFKETHPPPLRVQFPALSDAGVALLQGLLTLDPTKRLTVEAALAHPFFLEVPVPLDPRLLVLPPVMTQSHVQTQQLDDSNDRSAVKGRRLL